MFTNTCSNPVFFALYKVLFVTIEMRQMPFYGWIQDLSERDPTSLFNLFGLLPYDVPSFLVIGAWPVAMGVSMWIQQKLNPAPTDAMQAKIFCILSSFLNCNTCTISKWFSNLLDCKQHFNHGSTSIYYEKNNS